MRIADTLAVGAMALAVATLGCGGSTGITAEDLEGTWNATQYVYTNDVNTSESVDLIPTGASFAMTVTAASAVSTVFDDGAGDTSSNSGAFSSDGTSLTLAGDTFQAERSGSQLTLTDATSDYDFNNDGSDQPAALVIRMVRQ